MNKILKKSLPKNFDLEGHRGCRGLFPENTIPAFQKALELGVTTLEMDLIISKDHKIVVSHEPYFNHEITTTPEGKEILPSEDMKYNLYSMDYDQIKRFDVGLKAHPRFPSQLKIAAYKPLFSEVIDYSEKYTSNKICYNVEIKSTPEGDNFYHPSIETYSDLVCELITNKNIKDRILIQSFDLRSLQYLHKRYPDFSLSLLVENELTPEFNIQILGFVPHVYSPYYKMVDKHLIDYSHSKNMKVIPWTVNSAKEIQTLIDLGIDGVITDYPDLFV